MAVTISDLTREYIRAPITSEDDLTGSSFEFAFVGLGVDPVELDWTAADSWSGGGTDWIARILVGPGGTLTLGVADYQVWMRLTDTPERIVRRLDTLTVE